MFFQSFFLIVSMLTMYLPLCWTGHSQLQTDCYLTFQSKKKTPFSRGLSVKPICCFIISLVQGNLRRLITDIYPWTLDIHR
ncbi:uncharacterized protein GGS25DRAFT_472246 [Hypoxylon fragiforme]|uniref:uncharacterized protein n=1 Tax=Hypoxylon fragiforme TaxID=63214 RepID=UPI0020C6A146|nr:uncharacterized protein GGS25DRAFT_472246 [Hypoxylon fragiforme]KAI2614547.1 hypothetical protein GGS25DRAFT_472246 [Hypoxylon fragiforme]